MAPTEHSGCVRAVSPVFLSDLKPCHFVSHALPVLFLICFHSEPISSAFCLFHKHLLIPCTRLSGYRCERQSPDLWELKDQCGRQESYQIITIKCDKFHGSGLMASQRKTIGLGGEVIQALSIEAKMGRSVPDGGNSMCKDWK